MHELELYGDYLECGIEVIYDVVFKGIKIIYCIPEKFPGILKLQVLWVLEFLVYYDFFIFNPIFNRLREFKILILFSIITSSFCG